MPKTISINWEVQTKENIEILLKLGFKKPKKRKKASSKHTNLKDKGVPIKVQRNISCCCCKAITVEFITSYVPKELVSKDREAITDSIRTCKKCKEMLLHKTKKELVDIILHAYRTYTYN